MLETSAGQLSITCSCSTNDELRTQLSQWETLGVQSRCWVVIFYMGPWISCLGTKILTHFFFRITQSLLSKVVIFFKYASSKQTWVSLLCCQKFHVFFYGFCWIPFPENDLNICAHYRPVFCMKQFWLDSIWQMKRNLDFGFSTSEMLLNQTFNLAKTI